MRKRDVLAAAANGSTPWTTWPRRIASGAVVAVLAAGLLGAAYVITEVALFDEWSNELDRRYLPVGSWDVGLGNALLLVPFALLVAGGFFLGFLKWGWRVQRLRIGEWNQMKETNRLLDHTVAEAVRREESLLRERSSLAQQVDGLASEVEAGQQELTVALNRITEINVEFDTYRRQSAVEAFDFQTMRTEIDDANQTLESLKSEMEASDEIVSNLRNQIRLRDTELADTQQRLAEREATVFKLETEITAAREELVVLQAAVSDGNARVKVLETQLDISVTDRTDLMKQNGQISALETEVAAAIEQAEETATQLVVATERANHLEAKLAETAQTVEALHGELSDKTAELAAVGEHSALLQQELTREQAARRNLETTGAAAQDRIAGYEAQLQDLLLATSRRDRLEAELEQAHRNLADFERNAAANRTRIGELEGALSAAEARTDSLRKQLAAALRQTAELSVLQAELEGTKSRVTDLQSQLARAVERGSELQGSLAGAEVQIDKLESELHTRPTQDGSNGPELIDLRDSATEDRGNVVSIEPRLS